MKRTFLAALAAAALVAQPGIAHDFKAGDLTIDHPMAYATAPAAKAGAGYLVISNEGDAADRLLEVRADFPNVSIHKSEEVDGVMKMMPIEGLEVPAGGSVTLEPGGFHVMFMGLTEPLEAGSEIPATLVFEKAGEVEVIFDVEERGEEGMDHSGHGAQSDGDASD
ncbi:copper chaperone PCu(A)C [Roseovarius sp. SCSIO 43702]|uniref:copper chaperone PCu(A)C n=1 Tax=Roseovarius sp. SCSIO 43702 TaxID=2823043 RepID=UPI001C7343D4|nr:copper chaperone PCu(A)C [Roseovarius sp. SCSIO 43702]QYX56883.1 copper chaperone PCu(A)C [Roseovarius sp. SCSIO 43702]